MYTASSVAAVPGVLVNDGASLTFATMIVNDSVSEAPARSVTTNTTALPAPPPTFEFPGVPERTPVPSPWSVNVSHDGSVVAESVRVSFGSASVVVML